MRKIVFPPVENATEDGLVAVGGDMRPDTILEAYRQGIFPWPLSPEFPLAWFSPDPRGFLDFKTLHIPKSLEKFRKKSPFRLALNTSFTEIIRLCAAVPRKDQPNTWITPDIIHGYTKLFEMGHAWCAGAWLGPRLVGGVYGVAIDKFRSGESMFTIEDNAGKLALLTAIEHFQTLGIEWLDTQMVTPVIESFGGTYVPRAEFMSKLALALR
jgi:leucyl/phenylalanyl-tRNA--protein transferase